MKRTKDEIRYPDGEGQTFPKELDAPSQQEVVYDDAAPFSSVLLFSLLPSVRRLKGWKKRVGEGKKIELTKYPKVELLREIIVFLRKSLCGSQSTPHCLCCCT